MSLNRKTKILSYPAEEVLEVEAPVEVVLQQASNIEYLVVEGNRGEISFGVLTDYDGNSYNFQWDQRSNRIVRLTGKEVNKLIWDLCNDVLNKYYVKKEKPVVEEPVLPKLEEVKNTILEKIQIDINSLSQKIETINRFTPSTPPAPAPSTQQVVQRPLTMEPAPNNTESTEIDDFDISVNAATFLQNVQGEDLGIDYMSL